MKRVLLITSLCGVGRAGMYPQIVALERHGIQACPLPSVLLSTHTGGLGNPAVLPVGGQVAGALRHYLELEIKFDALVTGYLPEPSAADAIADFLEHGGAELYVCDPVMADGGSFYGGMGEQQAAAYRGLVQRADIIKPNATEAAILLGRDPAGEQDLSELAAALAVGRSVVLTGGGRAELKLVVAENGTVSELCPRRVEGSFIGTGDLFTAELTAALLDGCDTPNAARRAAEAVTAAAERSRGSSEDWRMGMEIEGR